MKAEDGTFFPTVKEITDSVGSYTKAIILNSRNNPSGIMYPKEFIQEMVEFCEKKSLYLIMDDIYNRLTLTTTPRPSATTTQRPRSKNQNSWSSTAFPRCMP